jgi:intermediate peptidase
LDHPHTDPLSTAETQVALTFLRDFEKSGIHLPPSVRARFVEISDSLLTLGRTFLSYAALGPTPKPPIEIPDAERLLTGMGSQFVDSLPRRGDTAYVVPGSWEAQMIQRYAREGEARRLVYVGNNKKEPERVDVLETMLKERAELAGVLNKGNWSEVVLTDKMAKNPENVMGFLNSLAKHHKTYASQDVAILKKLKATSLTGNFYSTDKGSLAHLPTFNAWDRDFYSEKYLQSLSPSTAATQPISPYFSTGNCLLGLSKLFTKLYGISFRPANLSPGEVWHKDVRKLEVVDENEGVIGVIYCDLFSRNGKPPSAAHYTVRCSRRVDDDDLEGDHLPQGWSEGLGDGLEDEGVRIKGREGKYQLPIVVLTTDFGNVTSGRPALLGWNDVETLFHEMGHAIHCKSDILIRSNL